MFLKKIFTYWLGADFIQGAASPAPPTGAENKYVMLNNFSAALLLLKRLRI